MHALAVLISRYRLVMIGQASPVLTRHASVSGVSGNPRLTLTLVAQGRVAAF